MTDPRAATMHHLSLARARALARGEEPAPFTLLGVQRYARQCEVRAYFPGAQGVTLMRPDAPPHTMQATAVDGLFVCLAAGIDDYFFRVHWPHVDQDTEDPYAFAPLLDHDWASRFARGDAQAALALGARCLVHQGVAGVRFAVWAPHARRVSVVGDFNQWDGRRHVMYRHASGVWELFLPRVAAGALYKYEILTGPGERLLKADPCARCAEPPPGTASVVSEMLDYAWHDGDWLQARARRDPDRMPMSIYEVHAGSWRHPAEAPSQPPDWRMLTRELIPYVREMGFTHIELMPLAEYPFGGSWGYQPVSLFALTRRYGAAEDFAAFVEACHDSGIGVILDWVPGHFPDDAHGLRLFDGTPLYEYEHPHEGHHPDWNTWIYDYRRPEVRAFLLASALYWVRTFHLDGLRVDAVASMLYRDYSRAAGEWIPNRYGGAERLEATTLLRQLNTLLPAQAPGVLMIAEESTAWPGVTRSPAEGGLGFSHKWNMGWMHDTLRYFARDGVHRGYHHDDITFGLVYAFAERFILPVSHDEVVHGKGALLTKMSGDRWRRFAGLRTFLALMWTHPGKKLLFMGSEWGQYREWDHDRALDWALTAEPDHAGIQALVQRLNHLYRHCPALHQGDAREAGFRWVIADDRQNSVFAWLREADDASPLLVVHNLTPAPRIDYEVGVPRPGPWRLLLNTDAPGFGGAGVHLGDMAVAEAPGRHGQPCRLTLSLPPMASLVLCPETELGQWG